MLKNPLYQYGPSSVAIPASVHLGEFLLDRISSEPDKVAVINASTDERIKYGEITQKSMNLAVSLYNIGIRKGQVVAIISENRLEYCPTVIGILCTGATLTAMNIGYTKGEMNHVLDIGKPDYVFCSPATYKTYEKILSSRSHVRKVIVFGNETFPNVINYMDLLKNNVKRENFEVVDVQGQTDVAIILYSSGTTGLPKGVMLTHLNVIATCCQPSIDVEPTSKSLTIAPWFHAMGLISLLIGMGNLRTSLYLPKFDVDACLTAIDKYQINYCTLVPTALVAITKSAHKYNLGSVLLLYCGAAPLSQETIEAAKAMFPNLQHVTQGYGMTEATLAITRDFGAFPDKSNKSTVGSATPGTTLKVTDLETGRPVGANQRGEICVKSVTIMKGYIGRERSLDFDDEGFFRTGDIGYYDEDGYFYIVDRLKELIKYKGFQVPPAEIEAVLLTHAAVRDAGVAGVAAGARGEVPRAYVALQPGASLAEGELQAFVAERLSDPKHLRGGVRFIDQIPRNPSGKILRRELRKMAEAEQKSKL